MSTPARYADRSAFPLICTHVDSTDLLKMSGNVKPSVWEAPALHPTLRKALHALNAAQDARRLMELAIGQEAA